MVRQWQKLFYGKRYAMTCLRSGAACRNKCGEVSCPEYTLRYIFGWEIVVYYRHIKTKYARGRRWDI